MKIMSLFIMNNLKLIVLIYFYASLVFILLKMSHFYKKTPDIGSFLYDFASDPVCKISLSNFLCSLALLGISLVHYFIFPFNPTYVSQTFKDYHVYLYFGLDSVKRDIDYVNVSFSYLLHYYTCQLLFEKEFKDYS